MSAWPRIVCTVRRSAPFSTMWVAEEWRRMCGEAARPETTDAARTICQILWRVSLRPPRAMNSRGDLAAEAVAEVPLDVLPGFPAASAGRDCFRYSVRAF